MTRKAFICTVEGCGYTFNCDEEEVGHFPMVCGKHKKPWHDWHAQRDSARKTLAKHGWHEEDIHKLWIQDLLTIAEDLEDRYA